MRFRKSLSNVLAVGVVGALLSVGSAVVMSEPAGARSIQGPTPGKVQQALCHEGRANRGKFIGAVSYVVRNDGVVVVQSTSAGFVRGDRTVKVIAQGTYSEAARWGVGLRKGAGAWKDLFVGTNGGKVFIRNSTGEVKFYVSNASGKGFDYKCTALLNLPKKTK